MAEWSVVENKISVTVCDEQGHPFCRVHSVEGNHDIDLKLARQIVEGHNHKPVNCQHLVASEINRRGYRDGWTERQFIARQIVKLLEEASELLHGFGSINTKDDSLQFAADRVGQAARAMFDDKDSWSYLYNRPDWLEKIRAEAADCAVVLMSLAEAVNRIDPAGYDLLLAALEKAQADVKRGVR